MKKFHYILFKLFKKMENVMKLLIFHVNKIVYSVFAISLNGFTSLSSINFIGPESFRSFH